MKKVFIILAVTVLVLGAFALLGVGEENQKTAEPTAEPMTEPTAAPAEESGEEREIFGLSGLVTEATEEYIVIADGEMGDVRVNLGEETVFEGIDAASLAVGQYVYVDYDGKMTRSLPPQVFALRLAAHVVTGTVIETSEGSVTVMQEGGEVVLHLPEGAPQIAAGQTIVAYTNGAMTMSLPPQMAAGYVVVK